MAKRLPSGHAVAYLVLILGMVASVTGNVSNVVLTPSTIHDGLRVPFAVIWPLLTYLGIEVLTRVQWERNWKHWLARVILLGPMAGVSAFMSYLHLHHLMVMSGEPGLAQAVGPLAIDGSLFGATVALLVTRASARSTDDGPKISLAQRVANARTNIQAVAAAAKGEVAQVAANVTDPKGLRDIDWDAELAKDIEAHGTPADDPAPVSPAVEDIRPRSPRPPRQSSVRNGWDYAKAVRLILEGQHNNVEIGDLVGISDKMIQRTRRAVQLLKDDTTAQVPADWKVPAQVLDVARREIRAAG